MSTLTERQVTEADRDRCIDLLNEAYAQGDLDKAELDIRIERVLTTEHALELEEVRADLPTVSAVPARPRRGRWDGLIAVGALVIMLGIAGVGAARIESEPAQQPTCEATGLTAPDSVECPELSDQQVELIGNADRAAAAAQQVAELSSDFRGAKLDRLATQAEAAADRGRDAAAHAQLTVALHPDNVEPPDLQADAQKAKAAAEDAIRAAVEANRITDR